MDAKSPQATSCPGTPLELVAPEEVSSISAPASSNDLDIGTVDLTPMDETTGALDIISAVLSLAMNELEGRGPEHVALYGVAELLDIARNKHAAFHIRLMEAVNASGRATT